MQPLHDSRAFALGFLGMATNLHSNSPMLTKLIASFIGHQKANRASERSRGALELPAPEREGGEPLLRALSRRHSSREFQSKKLPIQVLSNLLWSAFGINRPKSGDRTAPSALNAQEIDLYVALSEGVYLYAAKPHRLELIAPIDARRISGYQDFVDHAPLDIIYVADTTHTLARIEGERALQYAAISAGAITQNVYLYCASAGLATVARGLFDRKALGEALGLSDHEEVLLTQTVGYPG